MSIDFDKLIAQAQHHIGRGDAMTMDPVVVKQLAGLAKARHERIVDEIAGMTRVNPHIAVSKSGDPIFTTSEGGHDLRDHEGLDCPVCGGSGHVSDAEVILGEIFANDQRWRHFIGFLSNSDHAIDFHERFPVDRVPTAEEYTAAIDADRAAHKGAQNG